MLYVEVSKLSLNINEVLTTGSDSEKIRRGSASGLVSRLVNALTKSMAKTFDNQQQTLF
jgi:hypothetical protein